MEGKDQQNKSHIFNLACPLQFLAPFKFPKIFSREQNKKAIMKHIYEGQMSPEISNEGSTSGYDQERGSNATYSNEHVEVKNNACFWFPQDMDLDPLRMVLAEALGTFILMFCISGITAVTQLMGGKVGLVEYAATAALTVVVLVFSIGSISGAHFNPSVTIAFAIFEHFPWSKVPFYIVAQLVGSVLATYMGKLVYGIKPEAMITLPLQGSNSAFWVEFFASFILMFLASAMAFQARYVCQVSGFVFGIAIGLAVLITGPISGGSLNPARSLGPAIVSWKFDSIWIYLIAPIIGAVTGALMYKGLRLQRQYPCCSSTLSPSPIPLSHSLQ